MTSRITINLTSDGELEIHMNEAGRDLLVRALQALNEKFDHVHLATPELYDEITLSARAYRPTDTIIDSGKIILRTDDSDRQHYPHVMEPN